MSQNNRQMKLGAFFVIPGHHVAAWRHPDAQADDAMNFKFYKRLAQTAERGKFDMIFLADGLGGRISGDISSRFVSSIFEPLTLLSSLASVTSHIGLAATVSTTYNEPFHVARKFASLDHLSGRRRSTAEADELEAQLKELIHPAVGISLLSSLVSFDLSGYPIDGPLPNLPDLSEINGAKSRLSLLKI